VINSTVLLQGMKIVITPFGVENSLRNKKDGFVFFGSQNDTEYPLNDFIIRVKDNDNDEKNKGRHFQITFSPVKMKYFIRDLGSGFGSFLKIEEDTPLKNNTLINIGETYIVVTLETDEEFSLLNNNDKQEGKANENILMLKIFSDQSRHDLITFDPSQKEITMGRSHECTCVLSDTMLSRIHCSIEFLYGKWVIRDGYVSKSTIEPDGKNKHSTNGTWIYLSDDIPIRNDMVFKANHTLFQCKI
jgi:pSer/pThr/pTyr-binding forkhead associated (FHA) protein